MGIFRDGNGRSIKLNICGLTKETDIMLCSIVKIDAVGFRIDRQMTEARTDKLTPRKAKHLISKVHQPLNSVVLIDKAGFGDIDHILNLLHPDAVQLQEEHVSPATVKLLSEKYKQTEFIQTVYFKPDFPVQKIKKQIDSFIDYIDAITIDINKVDTEAMLNWLVCAELTKYIKKKGKHAVMAGKFNAENIEKAIQIVKPDMVDVLEGACIRHKETKEPLYGMIDNAKVITLGRIIEKINKTL